MANVILDRSALERLAEAARHATGRISLVLHGRDEGGGLQTRLESIARQIHEGTAGAVALLDGTGAEPPGTPALTIRSNDRNVVHYMAVPEGPEEAPFMEALTALADAAVEDIPAADLDGLTEPLEIVVFVARGCPNCPHGVRATTALAVRNPLLTVTVVDAAEFADFASRFQVRSVPTTVVNGDLTIVGVMTRDELVSRLAELQGPDAEDAIFISLMKSGRIEDAVARLVSGRGIAAFAKLWNESTLESRIGLSLTAQNAIEERGDSLDALVEHLLPGLDADDAARRGDTADLLGTIGHHGARAALEKLLDDEHPDVAEAAEDALAAIAERAEEDFGTS